MSVVSPKIDIRDGERVVTIDGLTYQEYEHGLWMRKKRLEETMEEDCNWRCTTKKECNAWKKRFRPFRTKKFPDDTEFQVCKHDDAMVRYRCWYDLLGEYSVGNLGDWVVASDLQHKYLWRRVLSRRDEFICGNPNAAPPPDYEVRTTALVEEFSCQLEEVDYIYRYWKASH